MFTENVSRLRRLVEGARHAEKPLVFSIPGSGLSAISAVKGGIPFLVVLNSGIYRISGVNSYASFLPFGNANEQTEELIRSQILPRCPQTPLVAGMLVGDPSCPEQERFRRLKSLGVAGIINWPPVSMNQGFFFDALRRRGFSEEREVAMLCEAKEQGFVTFGFSASIDRSGSGRTHHQRGVDVLWFRTTGEAGSRAIRDPPCQSGSRGRTRGDSRQLSDMLVLRGRNQHSTGYTSVIPAD